MKNEDANIRACLESVLWADEVFVVDSHSVDRTMEIAREYTDKIYQFEYRGGYLKKKNWALENLPFKHEWVLFLDGDERLTPELREEIVTVLSNPGHYDGFYINRRLIFLGRWVKHCGWYPSWNLRLFKHKLGRYERLKFDVPHVDVEVHEHVVLQGKGGYLKNDLIHDDYKSIYHFIDRQNRFTSWDAQMHCKMLNGSLSEFQIGASLFGNSIQRKRFIKRFWIRIPFRGLVRFIWMYFVRLGFLDGYPGFVLCMMFSYYETIVAAKVYEMRMGKQGPMISE